MKQGILVVISIFMAALTPANAADARMSGIYSDMSYNAEGGDLLGMELMIVPTPEGGYTAFVQIAEGGAPAVALVPLTVSGSRIEFTMPGTGGHFVGVITGDSLVGHWTEGQLSSTGGKEEHLKRGKSYWQQ